MVLKDWHWSLFLFFGVLGVYLNTMAPGVVNTDSGELAAVAYFWGVAHPTGYPLFTLLGHLFLQIPFGLRPIFQLNLLSGAFVAGGVAITFLFVLEWFKAEKRKLIPLFVALSLGFSLTIWGQSTSWEVYSLHILCFSGILWSLRRSIMLKEIQAEKYWMLTAVFLALGFSNHLTTLLILPGIAFLFFTERGFKKSSYFLLAKMILLFLALLAVSYSLIWIRAKANPIFNWGDPDTFERFWRHVTGLQYQVWMFSSSAEAIKNASKFFTSWNKEFGHLGIVLAPLGLFNLWKNYKRVFWFTVITFCFTVLYAINYSIHDLEPYFIPAHFMAAIWLGFGFSWIIGRFELNRIAHGLVFLSLLVVQVVQVYGKADRSTYTDIEEYTKIALESLPKDAILISRQWDVFNSPAYYLQFVEGLRPDVQIIGKELLRRSWYYDQLATMYPKTMEPLEPIVADFKQALVPFERQENYDAATLSRLYQEIFEGFILKNLNKRPVFIGPEIFGYDIQQTREYQLPRGTYVVPEPYFLKISKNEKEAPSKILLERPTYELRNRDLYLDQIHQYRSQSRIYQALYLVSVQDSEKAKKASSILKKYYPEVILPNALR